MKKELRRKIRTIARGMDTLHYMRSMLNPFRYGLFSWMLFSHKVCRWATPWAAFAAFLSLGLLAFSHQTALLFFILGVAFIVVGDSADESASERSRPLDDGDATPDPEAGIQSSPPDQDRQAK